MTSDEIKALLDKMAAMLHDIEIQTALVKAYIEELKKAFFEREADNDGDH